MSHTTAKFALLKAYQECLTNDALSETTIHGLLLDLITSFNTKAERINPTWAGRVAEVLNDHWNENILLDQLASLVGVHPVTISKFFPKYFQCTLGEYVRRLRVERSMDLMSGSHLSLTEIAYQCGFTDQSHFIRVFKRATGFLPGWYRTNLR